MPPLLLPRPPSVQGFDLNPPPPRSSPSINSSSGGGGGGGAKSPPGPDPLAIYTSYHGAYEPTAFNHAMRVWTTLSLALSPASSVTDAVFLYAATFALVVTLFALSRACVMQIRRAKRRKRAQRAASVLALERGRVGGGSGSGGWCWRRDGHVESRDKRS